MVEIIAQESGPGAKKMICIWCPEEAKSKIGYCPLRNTEGRLLLRSLLRGVSGCPPSTKVYSVSLGWDFTVLAYVTLFAIETIYSSDEYFSSSSPSS